jgi:hypothetical protein
MPVRFDRALEARRGCKRQRQEMRMRLEGDEVVEQWLNLVGPLVLVAGRAHADVVEGKPLARGFLDLMPQQESAGGLLLRLAFGERGEHGAQTPVADGPAEGCEHGVAELQITEPDPAWIVPFEQRDLAVEGAGMGVEDVLDAHGGELARLLGKERVEQRELLVARLRPAKFERTGLGELACVTLERVAGAFAEPLLIEGGKVAEGDRVRASAEARRRDLPSRPN